MASQGKGLPISEEVAKGMKATLAASFQKLYEEQFATVLEDKRRLESEIQRLTGELQKATAERERSKQIHQDQIMKMSSLLATMCEPGGGNDSQNTMPEEGSAPPTSQNMAATIVEKVTLKTSEPEPDLPMDTTHDNDDGRREDEEVFQGPTSPPSSLAMEEAAGSNSADNENSESALSPNLILIPEIKEEMDEENDCDNTNPSAIDLSQLEPFLRIPDHHHHLRTLQGGGGIRKQARRGNYTRQRKMNGGAFDLKSMVYGNGRDRTSFFGLRPPTAARGAPGTRKYRRPASKEQPGNDGIRIVHAESLVDTTQKIFLCVCGGDSFSSVGSLRGHIKYYNSDWKFTCNYCNDKRFPTLSGLKKHLRDIHKRYDLVGVLACAKCGELFHSKKEKVIHQNLDCTKKASPRK